VRFDMNTMPVEWHVESLRNARIYHVRLLEELELLTDRARTSSADNRDYAKQIERAIREKKPSFDRDNFKV